MINALEYGRALFMLTEELGTTETVLEDTHILDGVIATEPELIRLLDTPAVSKEERLAVVDAAFSTLDVNLVNLVKILTEKREAYSLTKVLGSYRALYDEARGIERVEAISAVELTPDQLQRLKAKLEATTGKTVIVTSTVDPSLLGGMKLRYMGIQLDGSLKTRLDGFERTLKQTVI